MTVTAKNVLCYVPNKIGYVRVITLILSCFLMKNHPIWTSAVYGISCLLDALDGTMARKYSQTSRFGSVLDMVTDRSTTNALICFLCLIYPKLTPLFQVLIALDLSSHYMHMYASLSCGEESHKTIEKDQWLLHLYYSSRTVLFIICFFNELFYFGVYLSGFPQLPHIKVPFHSEPVHFGSLIAVFCLPGYVFKQIANIVQLNRASVLLARLDARDATQRLRCTDSKQE
ncbi:HFR091Wp [Eremothecium sinecaudum]|uniref:CDP-diacylglycerol--inositol 3-phosphatidyltransferase n=1 Tax=Eremothecium sinecaudum TaxID=45286 RepID=A0A120K2M1_9SACH|nr:HFR091Wp [Eremothecium sinecaudum]AMD21946.1 HFR091Wp [Eremothecium sinecaudum]